MEAQLHGIVDHINLLTIPELTNVSKLLLVKTYNFLVKSIKFSKYSAS